MTVAVKTPVLTGRKLTAEELLTLPEDGHRYELLEGELVKMAPAGVKHGRIAMRIGALLEEYARRNNLGRVYAAETGFRIRTDPDTVRAADVSFVARERIPPDGEPDGYWELAPDLVVEVVSPYDSASYLQAKIKDWLDAGVKMVWVVYPETRSVTVHYPDGRATILEEGDILDGGDVLPDFRCPVREIFE